MEIIVPLPEPIPMGTAKEGEVIEAKERISLDFHMDGYRFSDEFMVIEGLSENVILGAITQ